MFCWHCGTKLPSVAAFCFRCGQNQAPDAVFDPAASGIAPDGWSWSHQLPSAAPVATPLHDSPMVPITVTVAQETSHDAFSTSPPDAFSFHPFVGLLALACGLLVVAGSFGPWVTAHVRFLGSIEIRGSEVDGRITAWCGIAAVSCLLLLLVAPQRRGLLTGLATFAFFAAAVIGVSDWTSVSGGLHDLRESGQFGLLRAEIGWGLRAVTFGGAGGTLLALLQILHHRIAANGGRTAQ